MSCPKSYRRRQTDRQKQRRAERRRKTAAGFQNPSAERMAEIRAEQDSIRADRVFSAMSRAVKVHPGRLYRKNRPGVPLSLGSQILQARRRELMRKGNLPKFSLATQRDDFIRRAARS